MNRIKEMRECKGIGQKELAEKINTSQQAISLYERGDREPKLGTWEKLANFFGVSIPYLQGISDYKDYEHNANSFKHDLYEKIISNISFKNIEAKKKLDDKAEKKAKKYIASIFVEHFINIFDAVIKNVDMGTELKDRYISLAKNINSIDEMNKINATVTRGLMLALEAQKDSDAKKKFDEINKIIFNYHFLDDDSKN